MLSRTTNILLALALALALGSTWRLDDDPEGLQATADDIYQAPIDARVAMKE